MKTRVVLPQSLPSPLEPFFKEKSLERSFKCLRWQDGNGDRRQRATMQISWMLSGLSQAQLSSVKNKSTAKFIILGVTGHKKESLLKNIWKAF